MIQIRIYFNLDIHTDLQKSHLQNCHNKLTNRKMERGVWGVSTSNNFALTKCIQQNQSKVIGGFQDGGHYFCTEKTG